MTRRLITIAIDAEETTCGECHHRQWDHCHAGKVITPLYTDNGQYQRLPECIAAERKEP